MQVVLFKNNNEIGVVIPTQEALGFATIEQIAEKDVPKDLPYWIVEDSLIPEDRTFRNAWTVDESIEPDGFGGESNEFDAELLAKYEESLND
jgi:hypothetical protein